MTSPPAHPQRLRVAHLNPNAPTPFHLRPDAPLREALAAELGLTGLPKLDFRGEIRAQGSDGWLLTATLTARVTQPCVVTLKPVRSDLSEPVRIQFSPHLSQPEGEEVEMPDETLEPLGNFIDLDAIMVEALSLALPEYPRAEGAALPDAPAPDEAPADTRRPFADLGRLMGRKED
ncbi:DUF177 domain-containing protein [Paracoccus aestuarii]|uniref:DUF177 domain-containing protein n=1 Tax=Paracoccus aestuarii TaxID=453842 RepID=A0A418ZSN6_9RHOB|nr:DUF177 domain-containing protein [Paracoccus aestuarii]RJL00301.1 DUF177 domain-containing protein [Paracoccus aestuarii]WCQ99681.1 DUF177 domain-containing protein [Paracoccus aestuarii]